MSSEKRIGIVGGGTMGSAIACLLTEKGGKSSQTCFIFDKHKERREALAGLGATVTRALDDLRERHDGMDGRQRHNGAGEKHGLRHIPGVRTRA